MVLRVRYMARLEVLTSGMKPWNVSAYTTPAFYQTCMAMWCPCAWVDSYRGRPIFVVSGVTRDASQRHLYTTELNVPG